jgi:hypothetical protein
MAHERVPVPRFPQLPVKPSRSVMARSIRSPWYDLPELQPMKILVFRVATLRASLRMLSGWISQISPAFSGV